MKLVPVEQRLRDAVEALMRDTDRPVREIAAQTGVRHKTIQCWNRRHRWRARRTTPVDTADWPAVRRAAVERLYRLPLVEIGDLAVAMGLPRSRAVATFGEIGLTGRRPGLRLDAGADGLTTRSLRAALRGHISRQIARFDAALSGEPPPTLDTARILRDLGGLKRLLDEADHDDRAAGGDDGAARSDGRELGQELGQESGQGLDQEFDGADLPALREAIAQRYAAWSGERADAGLPGEPAAPADPGAGP